MRVELPIALSSAFSTLDMAFAALVAIGFAFALLLVLSSGRLPRPKLFRVGRAHRVTLPRTGRSAYWQTVPGALPVGIGSFLIGTGLGGQALRGTFEPDWARALCAAGLGALFAVLFLMLVAQYFGGGAREEIGSALIGSVARVSLEIPAGGTGRIAIERAGRRTTMPARCQDGRALSRGTRAFVVGLDSGSALVEEL